MSGEIVLCLVCWLENQIIYVVMLVGVFYDGVVFMLFFGLVFSVVLWCLYSWWDVEVLQMICVYCGWFILICVSEDVVILVEIVELIWQYVSLVSDCCIVDLLGVDYCVSECSVQDFVLCVQLVVFIID